jgi:hypothetical protein
MSTMVKEVTPSNQGSIQLHTGINTKTHAHLVYIIAEKIATG